MGMGDYSLRTTNTWIHYLRYTSHIFEENLSSFVLIFISFVDFVHSHFNQSSLFSFQSVCLLSRFNPFLSTTLHFPFLLTTLLFISFNTVPRFLQVLTFFFYHPSLSLSVTLFIVYFFYHVLGFLHDLTFFLPPFTFPFCYPI